MAADWIKVRMDLPSHPKVVRMASALDVDRFRIVGGLVAAWGLFDTHSADGRLDGYTLRDVDEHLHWAGFAAAMCRVEWLEEGDGFVVIPRFQNHNGQSAKRRAQEAERKRNARNASASEADNKRTREEKKSSINPLTPADAGEYGSPTKAGRLGKAAWRWRETFEGVKQRGEQLGIPFTATHGRTGWTDDEMTHWRKEYRQKVERAHAESERMGTAPHPEGIHLPNLAAST